jgi:hypothetical protein
VSEGVMRHLKSDSLLVILSLLHGLVLLAAPSMAVVALGVWWNSNTVSHHFLHVPFFRSRASNTLYSLYLTVLLGIPQSFWRDRHLAHHGGHVMRLRLDTILAAETFAVITLWSLLLSFAPQFFAFVYLPGYVLGLGLCYLHGYYEHARGTTSHYGVLYNMTFFNDGYHVEHHRRPSEHWTGLPGLVRGDAHASRWPAVLRWMEVVNLESLERLVLRFKLLQWFLLKTHERALRKLLPKLVCVRTVTIVGGGMYPRTALLLGSLLPEATLTIVDADSDHLAVARTFLNGSVRFEHRFYNAALCEDADLLVIPLSFHGERQSLYKNPPAQTVLIHDWLWSKRGESAIVSLLLLKRMNLIVRCEP